VPSNEGLIDNLAGAILDGAPIDLASAESSADDTQRPLVDQLRLLAGVATLHRRLPSPLPSEFRTLDDLLQLPLQSVIVGLETRACGRRMEAWCGPGTPHVSSSRIPGGFIHE
jgi:hypothetical protein